MSMRRALIVDEGRQSVHEGAAVRLGLGVLHEGRVLLGEVRGYSMRSGPSWSTHNPWWVGPDPRAVRAQRLGRPVTPRSCCICPGGGRLSPVADVAVVP